MAETYGLFDVRSLPLRTVATLSAGLRDDSRIKMQLRGDKIPRQDILTATIADGVNALLWRFGAYKEVPKSIVEAMLGIDKPTSNVKGFRTGAELEAALAEFNER